MSPSPACYEIMTLLQFLDVNFRVLDVNPILKGGERKLTKNKEVPIIRYEKDKSVYESDPKKIIRYGHKWGDHLQSLRGRNRQEVAI